MRPTLKEFENMSFPMPYVPWLSFPRWAQEALYINGLCIFIELKLIARNQTLPNILQHKYWIGCSWI